MKSPKTRQTWHYIFEKIRLQTRNINGLQAPDPRSLFKSGDALRETLAAQGAWGNIKPMPGRVNIPVFSPFLYRLRNLVERFFNKLKHFRAIATRFEKHDANYLALVKLAAIKIWMRFMSR